MNKTLWVLTEEYNLYDQEGQYFLCAWREKPSSESLSKLLMVSLEKAEFIFSGGGRKGTEDHWYNLIEVDEGKL